MAERFKAHAWKACIEETLSWVRIPFSPPLNKPYFTGVNLDSLRFFLLRYNKQFLLKSVIIFFSKILKMTNKNTYQADSIKVLKVLRQ